MLVDKALYKEPKLRRAAMELCLSMLGQKYLNEENVFIDLAYGMLSSMKWRNLTKRSWY